MSPSCNGHWAKQEAIVVSWDDLKLCMCVQFVPPHYRKKLLLKLQRLQQGPRSVDEYFKDLETTLTKIDMHENEKSKIARFVSGLRREIQDVVELYEYSSLEKLVHLAIKVESKCLKKTHFKTTHNDGFYKSSWKNKNQTSSKTFLPNLKTIPLTILEFLNPHLLHLSHPPKP